MRWPGIDQPWPVDGTLNKCTMERGLRCRMAEVRNALRQTGHTDIKHKE